MPQEAPQGLDILRNCSKISGERREVSGGMLRSLGGMLQFPFMTGFSSEISWR
jgi:hypothetical protein